MRAETSEHTKHIVLIGMRGSGKSTVGRLVARALGRDHIDTDDLVVAHAGRTISEIFAGEGEAGFRKREREAVAEAVLRTPAVVSVGGGAVLDEANVRVLRASGVMVWLTAPPNTLQERTQADRGTPLSRPALSDLSRQAEMEAVLKSREPIYRAAADIEVDTSCQSLADVVSSVVQSVAAAHD